MNLDDIKQVAVIGAGSMGCGIAQVFAVNGYDVALVDLDRSRLDKALKSISGSLDRIVKRDKITSDDKVAALNHIETTTELT